MKPELRSQMLDPLAALVLVALAASSLRAEDIIITSFYGPSSADLTPCPPSCVTGSVSGSGSTACSSALPMPISGSRRARYGYAPDCSWSITPTDTGPLVPAGGGGPYSFTSLHDTPGRYKIFVTQGNAATASSDVVVTLTATGGVLADNNGVQQAAISLAVFQAGQPRNSWIPVGYISNNVPNPTITFTYASGTLSSTARWYMDAVRFEDLCCCPYVPPLAVMGLPVASQTTVLVTNVLTDATNVTVYANGSPVGSTNCATGLGAGTLTVPTAPLIAGSTIMAVQTKQGCASLMLCGPTVIPLCITNAFTGATAIWGRTAALSVGAIGMEPLCYQWFKDGAALASATNSRCSLPVVQLGDGGFYSVVVSNPLMALTNGGPLAVRPADVDLRFDSDAHAVIRMDGVAGYTYRVQCTTDLCTTNSWLTLTNLKLQQASESWVDFSLDAATNPCRFYRILPAP
jgi:hypothetical protein